jgi:ABC-type Zn2+ transport system substrate-binding protein/surface adhesin
VKACAQAHVVDVDGVNTIQTKCSRTNEQNGDDSDEDNNEDEDVDENKNEDEGDDDDDDDEYGDEYGDGDCDGVTSNMYVAAVIVMITIGSLSPYALSIVDSIVVN